MVPIFRRLFAAELVDAKHIFIPELYLNKQYITNQRNIGDLLFYFISNQHASNIFYLNSYLVIQLQI